MMYRKKPITIKAFILMILIGGVLTLLTLLYSQDFSMIGFIDALFIAGFLLITIGWFLFISNEHVFSLFIYGVQSFWLNVVGKTKDKNYIEYVTEKPKIADNIYKLCWFSGIPFIVASLILMLIS